MISDGWTVTGPSRSQFWLPLTLTPIGVSTSSWSTIPTTRIGRARRFHAGTDSRDATTRATAPTAAKPACLRKIE